MPGTPGYKFLAPYPPLIGIHRAAGRTDEDLDRGDTTGKVRTKGETGRVVFSVKLHLRVLLGMGWKDKDCLVESQFLGQTLVRSMEWGGGAKA